MILIVILFFLLMVLAGLAGIVASVLHSALATPLFLLTGSAAMAIISALTLDYRRTESGLREYAQETRRLKGLRSWGNCQDCGQFAQLQDTWRYPYCPACLQPAKRDERQQRYRQRRLAHIDEQLERLRREGRCAFLSAWCDCAQPLAADSDCCLRHRDLRCVVCQAPARHECDAAGSWICGTTLCQDHLCRQHDLIG